MVLLGWVGMEILFADEATHTLCCRLDQLRRTWGPEGGASVARRLQQMRAAPTLATLQTLPGRCRPGMDGNGTWVTDVPGVGLIVFRPDATTTNGHDIRTATRATVISVTNPAAPGGSQ
jgi:hypothetical protein